MCIKLGQNLTFSHMIICHGIKHSVCLRYSVSVCKLLQFCLTVTPWTAVHQAPLSIGSSRQEYWTGLPHPPPGDLPDPGIKPASLMSPALAGRFFTTSTT